MCEKNAQKWEHDIRVFMVRINNDAYCNSVYLFAPIRTLPPNV
jgi:hypothetical protein